MWPCSRASQNGYRAALHHVGLLHRDQLTRVSAFAHGNVLMRQAVSMPHNGVCPNRPPIVARVITILQYRGFRVFPRILIVISPPTRARRAARASTRSRPCARQPLKQGRWRRKQDKIPDRLATDFRHPTLDPCPGVRDL